VHRPHRHDDELGLIDMRGRVYDPAQKRFLSPDPRVTDPLFGQNYNRYSYVLNNPLRFTDPTGFDQNVGDLKSGPEPTGMDATAQEAKFVDVVAEIWAPVVDVIGKSDDGGHKEDDKKRQKASDQTSGGQFLGASLSRRLFASSIVWNHAWPVISGDAYDPHIGLDESGAAVVWGGVRAFFRSRRVSPFLTRHAIEIRACSLLRRRE
jgi:RHS repeat-associated protein